MNNFYVVEFGNVKTTWVDLSSKIIHMLVLNNYFYKNRTSKLYFGDRVTVLNDFIYQTRGSRPEALAQHVSPLSAAKPASCWTSNCCHELFFPAMNLDYLRVCIRHSATYCSNFFPLNYIICLTISVYKKSSMLWCWVHIPVVRNKNSQFTFVIPYTFFWECLSFHSLIKRVTFI
jgi:hypothetical protein